MVQLEDVSSAAPRALALTLPAQCRLSLRLFCAVSGREAAHSAGHTAADLSVNEYKQRFQAPAAYWLFGIINMSIVRLNIMHFFFCYSDAGSVLHETKK